MSLAPVSLFVAWLPALGQPYLTWATADCTWGTMPPWPPGCLALALAMKLPWVMLGPGLGRDSTYPGSMILTWATADWTWGTIAWAWVPGASDWSRLRRRGAAGGEHGTGWGVWGEAVTGVCLAGLGGCCLQAGAPVCVGKRRACEPGVRQS